MSSKIYILLWVMIFVSSCNGNLKIRKEVEFMQSCPINMESCNNGICFSGGTDTLYHYTMKSPYTLVIYVDSLSCTQCFITNLIEYKECIEDFNRLGAESVIIFEPKNKQIKETASLLKSFAYPFMTIVIKDAQFSATNPHLSSNPALRCFLLNRNKDVVIVGNPVRNSKIRNLMQVILITGDEHE